MEGKKTMAHSIESDSVVLGESRTLSPLICLHAQQVGLGIDCILLIQAAGKDELPAVRPTGDNAHDML